MKSDNDTRQPTDAEPLATLDLSAPLSLPAGAIATPVALRLSPETKVEDAVRTFHRLAKTATVCRWWLADLALALPKQHRQGVLDIVEHHLPHIRADVDLANRVPPDARKPRLSHAHHLAVAQSCQSQTQIEFWLDAIDERVAAGETITPGQIRAEIHEETDDRAKPAPSEKVPVTRYRALYDMIELSRRMPVSQIDEADVETLAGDVQPIAEWIAALEQRAESIDL